MMRFLQYVLLGFAPGLFWLWYFRRKDDFEPEPRLLLVKVFALGGLAALAVYYLGPLLHGVSPELPGGWKGRVLEAFVLTALLEESVKLGAFFFGAWIRSELDEPLDGLIYGTAIGRGI
ncbi:MAG: PrsW family glutamic-type intramembrane protease, partial [Planctomycetota bacterium]